MYEMYHAFEAKLDWFQFAMH